MLRKYLETQPKVPDNLCLQRKKYLMEKLQLDTRRFLLIGRSNIKFLLSKLPYKQYFSIRLFSGVQKGGIVGRSQHSPWNRNREGRFPLFPQKWFYTLLVYCCAARHCNKLTFLFIVMRSIQHQSIVHCLMLK